MASESTEEGMPTLTLPADLDDWLDDRATKLDVDRETLLVQLLSSYRATAKLDGDDDGNLTPGADGELVADVVGHEVEQQLENRLRPIVEATVESVLRDRVEAEVEQQLRTTVDSAISDRVDEAVEGLDERVDGLEAEYKENLEDVRNRVIQVKRETDTKAPRDHSHEELERAEGLADRLADIEETLEETDLADNRDEIDERIEEIEDRLQTVAWAVSDLKDAQRTTGRDAVEHIKRSAARAGIDSARCENCAKGVDISLLTEPQCPHCQATLTEVTPSEGLFTKPQLLVASRLESGEDT